MLMKGEHLETLQDLKRCFCIDELIYGNRQPDQRAKKMSRDQPRLKSRIRFITMNCSE